MKLSLLLSTLLAVLSLSLSAQAAPALQVSHLRCEYKENPRGIDAARPRLSWQLQSDTRGQRQTACEIFVASSEVALAAGRGNLWDSGKIASADSTAVEYRGSALASGSQYWWKVRVWDKDGHREPDSPASFWQMGLLHPSDWKAQWISALTPRDTEIDGNNLPPCPMSAGHLPSPSRCSRRRFSPPPAACTSCI